MEPQSIFTVVHLLGVALGAGGAFVSDAMFFRSIDDKSISPTEFRFLQLGSKMVWIGLFLLFVSGLSLFFLDPDYYLHSSKFLAKVTIVAVIAVNGLLFLRYHMPFLKRHQGEHLLSSDEFTRKIPLLLASGVVSVTSWLFALILGSFRSFPLNYWQILLAYGVAILLGFGFLFFLRTRIFPSHHKKR